VLLACHRSKNNLGSHASDLLLILCVRIDLNDVFSLRRRLRDADGLAELDSLFLVDWAFRVDVFVIGHQLAQIHIARQYRDLTTIIERQLDGEGHMSTFFDVLRHFAGGVDGQVFPAGANC
jgi:hypothetical protein